MSVNLQEESKKIFDNAKRLKQKLLDTRKELLENIDSITQDIQEAKAGGDLSENAEFTESINALKQATAELQNNDGLLSVMSADFDKVQYKPIGMIILYSTFRLRDSYGREFIFKLFPEDITDIEQHILAKNSRLGKALWLKEAGNTVHVEHRETKDDIEYTVLEVY